MRLLVLHQNFPGQFGHLVKAWSQRAGWDVRALGRDTAPGLPGFAGLVRYKLARAHDLRSVVVGDRFRKTRVGQPPGVA